MCWNLRSSGSTHRSRTRPLGRKDSKSVRDGNVLCARALILIVLAAAKCCFWVLEQPMSSVMEFHPLFQRCVRLLSMRKLSISRGTLVRRLRNEQFCTQEWASPHLGGVVRVCLGYCAILGLFGKWSPKLFRNAGYPKTFNRSSTPQTFKKDVYQQYPPMSLQENPTAQSLAGHGCLDDLHAHARQPELEAREMAVQYLNSRGERCVHGGRDLKQSQSYPKHFGVSLAKVRSAHLKSNRRRAMKFLREARSSTGQFDYRPKVNRAWVTGGDLQSVIDFLSSQ